MSTIKPMHQSARCERRCGTSSQQQSNIESSGEQIELEPTRGQARDELPWSYDRLKQRVARDGSVNVLLCIQGGGSKGAWQGGVLDALLASSSPMKPVAAIGSSAGAINAWLVSRKLRNRDSSPYEDAWLTVPRHWVRLIAMLVTAARRGALETERERAQSGAHGRNAPSSANAAIRQAAGP